jgi:hypothetical protein
LISTVVSYTIASNIIVGVTVVGCIAFAVLMVLLDNEKRSVLVLFSRQVTVFIIPLLFIYFYLVLIWGTKILIG